MAQDTIPPGLAVGEFAELLIQALQVQFPTVAIRRHTQDGLAIEDEAGNDWELQIHSPQSLEQEATRQRELAERRAREESRA